MSISQMMIGLAAALPEDSKQQKSKTIREVGLSLFSDGRWQAMAGGHWAVPLGEWGGDFDGCGDTAEDAIDNCLQNIIEAR